MVAPMLNIPAGAVADPCAGFAVRVDIYPPPALTNVYGEDTADKLGSYDKYNDIEVPVVSTPVSDGIVSVVGAAVVFELKVFITPIALALLTTT